MSSFNMPPSLSNTGAGLISNPNILSGPAGSNAHINPNFLNQAPTQLLQAQLGGGIIRNDRFNNPIMPNFHSGITSASNSLFNGLGPGPNLSDGEFEAIMEKNRTVAATAINRAMQHASVEDYSRAIEPLVTAITLIGQSKIANDPRCKSLINTLKDTKRNIEDKSHASK